MLYFIVVISMLIVMAIVIVSAYRKRVKKDDNITKENIEDYK